MPKAEDYKPRDVIEKINDILLACGLNTLTDKKARTHGGEWYGPCPHCKLTGVGGNNEDRLSVWPARPVDGQGSRDDPIFFCRWCKYDDDPDRKWTGDLVQFVKDTLFRGDPYRHAKARQWLGLDPDNGKYKNEPRVKRLTPTTSYSGAPNLEWQARGFEFVKMCIEILWGPDGAKALAHLKTERALTEETIRKAELGWNPEERYEDGELWGQEGRIRIPKGWVIPEYHASATGGVELWSIAIRRTKLDLANEEFNTERKPAKYWLISGSQKSLYGAESIARGKRCVLVEGQFDALTVLQVGRGEFGAAATQGAASGMADPRIIGFWLARASGILLCQDPDQAGEEAYKFWSSLPGTMPHRPVDTDLNGMLAKGQDVYSFLQRGSRKLEVIYPDLNPAASAVEPEMTEQTAEQVPSEVEEKEPQNAVSAPNRGIEEALVEAMWERGCTVCGGPIEHIVEDGDEVRGYCVEHVPGMAKRCMRCAKEAKHFDRWEYGWCAEHFASFQLMEKGHALGYAAIDVPAGEGLVRPRQGDEVWHHFEYCEEARCPGGRAGYLEFAMTKPPAQVWMAMYEAHALAHGKKRKEPERPAGPTCARAECNNDPNIPYRLRYEKTGKYGNGEYLYPPEKPYTYTLSSGTLLKFCGRCTLAGYLMEMMELLSWRAFDAMPGKVQQGEAAWVEFVTTAKQFDIVRMYDEVRRKHRAAWKSSMDYIHVL